MRTWRGGAPVPKAEYVAFRQAIDQLAAIGRNLNQIARTLGQGARTGLPGRQEVAVMLKVAEALRDHFRVLMEANQKSWEEGRAERSH